MVANKAERFTLWLSVRLSKHLRRYDRGTKGEVLCQLAERQLDHDDPVTAVKDVIEGLNKMERGDIDINININNNELMSLLKRFQILDENVCQTLDKYLEAYKLIDSAKNSGLTNRLVGRLEILQDRETLEKWV